MVGGQCLETSIIEDYEKRHITLLRCIIDVFEPKTVLDLGCGNGNIAYSLKSPSKVVMVDRANSIKQGDARKRQKKIKYDFQIMNLDHQFPKGKYDVVLLSEVIYYLNQETLSTFLTSINNCLKCDGTFVISWHQGSLQNIRKLLSPLFNEEYSLVQPYGLNDERYWVISVWSKK